MGETSLDIVVYVLGSAFLAVLGFALWKIFEGVFTAIGGKLADWFFGLLGKKTDAVVCLGTDIEDFTGRQSDIKALNEALKKHKVPSR